MLNKSCNEFIEELSSKASVPGGGSSCAFVGSLGSALSNMVCQLTLGKKKYEHVEEDIKKILTKSTDIIERLKELVKKDMEAFLPLAKAYGMPSQTEEEKALKEEVMQKALVEASIIPLEIARCCGEAIDLHEELEIKGSRPVISDVGVGALFCMAALQGANLNILINTSMMNDSIVKDCILAEIDELISKYVPKAESIYERIKNTLV
ncbi:MAG: cyclodeaminase/cyclohydrolase family protein [Peptostreptococcales bacterium]